MHNFGAGPSPLPTDVLEEAARGLLNYEGSGMGVAELSHRSKEFEAIIKGAVGELVFGSQLAVSSHAWSLEIYHTTISRWCQRVSNSLLYSIVQ